MFHFLVVCTNKLRSFFCIKECLIFILLNAYSLNPPPNSHLNPSLIVLLKVFCNFILLKELLYLTNFIVLLSHSSPTGVCIHLHALRAIFLGTINY